MVVLIIGSRFGGTAIPSVLEDFDFERLRDLSSKPDLLDDKNKLSITQLEILKAAEQSIPVYAYVDEKVFHDHHVYEKNKGNQEIINSIEFPSIQKKETARYIFEFINFLTHRTHNNSIVPFSRLDDIKKNLIGQWSQLFQRLLSESRTRAIESRRYVDFSERLDDLKAVVMASISTPNLRDTARGAIQFRHMISFLSSLHAPDLKELLVSNLSWDELLERFHIKKITDDDQGRKYFRREVFLVKDDGTFYHCRYSLSAIDKIMIEWGNFVKIDKDSRSAIVDASLEDHESSRIRSVVHVNKDFNKFIREKHAQQDFDISVEQSIFD
jgi:hypothetical protein